MRDSKMAVKVFLVVNTLPEKVQDMFSILKGFEEVTQVCTVDGGPYDIIAMVQVEDLDGYRLLIEKVAAIPYAEDFSSFITVDS